MNFEMEKLKNSSEVSATSPWRYEWIGVFFDVEDMARNLCLVEFKVSKLHAAFQKLDTKDH